MVDCPQRSWTPKASCDIPHPRQRSAEIVVEGEFFLLIHGKNIAEPFNCVDD